MTSSRLDVTQLECLEASSQFAKILLDWTGDRHTHQEVNGTPLWPSIYTLCAGQSIFAIGYMRPCKIQCTFYCHRVEKIILPLFVYDGHPLLGSK